MKSGIAVVLISIVLFASCKGEDNVNVYAGSGNWKLGSTTYQVYKAYKAEADHSLIAETGFPSGENITFRFQSLPTADGVYKVRKFGFFDAPPGPSDVTIIATGSGKNYGSLEIDSLNSLVMVKITNGKINLSLADSRVYNLSGNDSIKLVANIVEN
jgi:hypothetical protein